MAESIKYCLHNDYFKINDAGIAVVKKVNYGLLSILGIYLFIAIFYIIILSCTSYSNLDSLEDLIDERRKVEAFDFDTINLGMKIMPSYNTEKNVLYMHHSNDFRKTKIPNSQGLMDSFDMNETFFTLNKTNKIFPKFKFTKDNVPVGDSVTMCLAVHWAPKERGKVFDIMKNVNGFSQCSMTESKKYIWNEDDPIFGADIPVWKQKFHEANCNDDECDEYCAKKYNGFFVDGIKKHVCYSYDIIDGICLIISYDEVRDEYIYKGGCFENDSPFLLKPAKMNEVYYFGGIEIEVRNENDPIVKAAYLSNYTYSFGKGWKYFAIFLNIVLVLNTIALCYFIYLIISTKKKLKNAQSGLSAGENNNDNVGGDIP